MGYPARTRSIGRVLAGVLIGFAAWIALGSLGFLLLRTTWPAYASAEPDKAYSLAMLFARLFNGVVCSIAAGCIAATIAKRDVAVAWWLGGVLLLLSLPVHLIDVWADYPAWYHFAYLVPLMPITGWGGRLAADRRPAG